MYQVHHLLQSLEEIEAEKKYVYAEQSLYLIKLILEKFSRTVDGLNKEKFPKLFKFVRAQQALQQDSISRSKR